MNNIKKIFIKGILIKMIALNENVNNQLHKIISDFSSLDNKYWLTKREVESIVNVKTWTNYEKALSLLKIYNDFYWTNYEIENIFNISYIKKYHEYKNKVNVEYWNNDNQSFLDKFLSIIFFKNIYIKLKNVFKNQYLVKDKTTLFLIIIIFIVIIYILFIVYNTYFSDNNEITEWNKIQQIINN